MKPCGHSAAYYKGHNIRCALCDLQRAEQRLVESERRNAVLSRVIDKKDFRDVPENDLPRIQELEALLQRAKSMAEFGDINAEMEDDGIGWKQWYADVTAALESHKMDFKPDKGQSTGLRPGKRGIA